MGASLVAAYLHGSATMGGLRPSSDVDVLLVVDDTMPKAIRRHFLSDLMRISSHPQRDDARRPLEVIVFTTPDLEKLTYPPRSDFVYGEWLRKAFEAGAVPEPQPDPEFTVVLAQARQASQTLAGPEPAHLLPVIADHDLRRAIGDARKGLIAAMEGDERNVLLTLARMWCTLTTGKIVPKDTAADWVLPRLSGTAARLLDSARLEYLGLAQEDWASRTEVKAVVQELSAQVQSLLPGAASPAEETDGNQRSLAPRG